MGATFMFWAPLKTYQSDLAGEEGGGGGEA